MDFGPFLGIRPKNIQWKEVIGLSYLVSNDQGTIFLPNLSL